MNYKVKDISLAQAGLLKIEWAQSRMPVLAQLRKQYEITQPLKGMRIAGCIHITKETAVLIQTLIAAGAQVSWCGCNPLSTQDDIAAALASSGVSIYAWHGLNTEEFYWCIRETLKIKPTLTLDDGADLVFTLHKEHPELMHAIYGGTEETTTGVQRLRAMAEDKALHYPILAINDSVTKWDFDNVYGTGQSSLDGILRATSVLIAGKTFVVAGYGHCGKGVAMRAKGLGANVVVTEISPIAALKATLEGFRVMPMIEAAQIGDIFITTTGMKDIITETHFKLMKDGAIVCNTGHYDCELRLEDLKKLSASHIQVRPNNHRYTLHNGKHIYVLAEGRLVNLAAAEGHPSEVMDMSFANQLLGLIYLSQQKTKLEHTVHKIPQQIHEYIATLKLETMNIAIDTLNEAQKSYATDYASGT